MNLSVLSGVSTEYFQVLFGAPLKTGLTEKSYEIEHGGQHN